MSSRREEERNEKIIRGLMKLPPNRRCINCNSMGPQYVCTNFWTFVCITCSGIHREFTHRVKSVSMAKFTSQEVDALQKGGNQRAREIYLKAWDPQRQRLPDNSNIDKVREFIKHVYVDKKYAVEKSSDRPPRDPQSLRSHEDETRRASSYHSYSQSPPYDFQYEERRYGKHAPVLTRKPGSDRGLYEGKISTFSSPSRFSDHANDESFANEAPYRASDYSASSGCDPFRSDVLSPNSQRDTGSPFSETSRDISSEVSWPHKVLHSSDSNSRVNGVRTFHRQRTGSSGSFGSFDGSNSMSFKSVSSMALTEVASEPEKSSGFSNDKSSSFPSIPQSSGSGNFDGVDLFSASSAPDTIIAQSVDFFEQSISSVPTSTNQYQSDVPNPSSLDLFAALPQQQSSEPDNGNTSDMAMPSDGGWATFDMSQNSVPQITENSAPAAKPSCDGNIQGHFNPFSLDLNSSQDSIGHEPSAERHTVWHEGLQNASTNSTPLWNAFEDSAGEQPFQTTIKDSKPVVVQSAPNADRFYSFDVYEAIHDNGNVRILAETELSSSGLSSDFSMPPHEFSVLPAAAGGHSVATDHKPSNPFDFPLDSDMESGNMSQYWDMSSLQVALPGTETPASYVGGVNQSWFPQSSIPSYVPGGVTFDHPSSSMAFIAGQAPAAQIPTIPAPGPVASVGGNPFA